MGDPVAAISGFELGTILRNTGPVIDQHQLEARVVPTGTVLVQGSPRDVLEHGPIPALVSRACLFERVVGRREMLAVLVRMLALPTAHRHDATDQQQRHEDAGNPCQS